METVYRFVNTDTPKEYIETTVFSDIKEGSEKAMADADVFALIKTYKVSTEIILDNKENKGIQEQEKPTSQTSGKTTPGSSSGFFKPFGAFSATSAKKDENTDKESPINPKVNWGKSWKPTNN